MATFLCFLRSVAHGLSTEPLDRMFFLLPFPDRAEMPTMLSVIASKFLNCISTSLTSSVNGSSIISLFAEDDTVEK